MSDKVIRSIFEIAALKCNIITIMVLASEVLKMREIAFERSHIKHSNKVRGYLVWAAYRII